MIGEVVLGNANVCSYQIALEKNIQDRNHSEKSEKGKGRITCPTSLVFLSMNKMSHSLLLHNLQLPFLQGPHSFSRLKSTQ